MFNIFDELQQNNLLQSFLSQTGANLAGEGSVAADINSTIQKNIAAQSQAKEQDRQMQLLAKYLGKGVDFKSSADGKVSVSGENMASVLGGGETSELGTVSSIPGPGAGPGGSLGGAAADGSLGGAGGFGTAVKPTQPEGLNLDILKGILNPKSSPSDVPAFSDLVGLTPENVSQALAGATGVESLKQRTISDIASQGIQREVAKTGLRKAKTSELVAKTNLYKAMNKDERTAAVKNYDFAQTEEGGNFKGTFTEFQNSAETTHKRDFDVAKDGGYEGSFNEWMLEMAKAGAITIGEITEREKAKGDIAGQLYFTKGDFIKDVEKHINSENIQNKLIAFKPEEREIEAAKARILFIEDSITARNGVLTEVKFSEDGKSMIWSVKWPSGDIEEIRYGIRP